MYACASEPMQVSATSATSWIGLEKRLVKRSWRNPTGTFYQESDRAASLAEDEDAFAANLARLEHLEADLLGLARELQLEHGTGPNRLLKLHPA